MTVVVGSKNPVKINAVKTAFAKVFPNETWEVTGVDVASSVADQPLSSKESIKGAKTRAQNAFSTTPADFGVGIEAGLQEINGEWFETGWVVVIDNKGLQGTGATIAMQVPESFMQHIRNGKELGEVDDLLFKDVNTKHNLGHFGLMTNSVLTREKATTDGVISALVRFLHTDLYE